MENDNILTPEIRKYLSLAGYISNAMMTIQVIEKETLYGFCKRKFEWITPSQFDQVVGILKDQATITDITDKYVYQTATALFSKSKSYDEIIALVAQLNHQHHSSEC